MSGQAEVVAEGLHSSNGGELAIREIEPGAKPVLQAGDGFMKEEIEKFAAFAEDAPERFGHGEDELAVRDVEADVVGDPVAGLFNLALVAARAEVAGFAGEGEELSQDLCSSAPDRGLASAPALRIEDPGIADF